MSTRDSDGLRLDPHALERQLAPPGECDEDVDRWVHIGAVIAVLLARVWERELQRKRDRTPARAGED